MKKTAKKSTKAKIKSPALIDNYANIRLTMFMHAGIYTLVMIAAIGGIGYLLDLTFGTYPKLMIVGLFLGYPITVIFLRKQFKKLAVDKINKIKNGKS